MENIHVEETFISQDLSHNFLGELKDKKHRVQYLMEEYPEARNDDSYLCVLYWKLVDGAKSIDDILHCTKPEVIRRARQKIQETGLLLPTDETIRKRRNVNKQIMTKGIKHLN